MAAHRQAFSTPRGDGESDPEGGVARLPDVVARRLWWVGTTHHGLPSPKRSSGFAQAGATRS